MEAIGILVVIVVVVLVIFVPLVALTRASQAKRTADELDERVQQLEWQLVLLSEPGVGGSAVAAHAEDYRAGLPDGGAPDGGREGAAWP